MPTDQSLAYATLLAAQAEAQRLLPGSDEWLDAAGRAQEAWAALVEGRQLPGRHDEASSRREGGDGRSG